MIYYIYYGYLAGCTLYKLYEYWELFRFTYKIGTYTYVFIVYMYSKVKKEPIKPTKIDEIKPSPSFIKFDEDEWDMCIISDNV